SDQFIPTEEAGKGTYRVEIPYTKTIDWEVEAIRETKADSLIKVKEIAGEDKIELTLSKEALKTVYEKNKKIYGSTVTVPIRAEFGEGTKAETHNLKVTLPKMPIQLEAAKKAIDAVSWKNLSLNYSGADTRRLVEENRGLVEEQLAKIVAVDSDLTYTITGTAQAPTKTAAGKIEYTVILTDVISQTQRRLTPVFVIERMYTTPGELEAEVIAAVSQWSNGKITNQTQIEEILSSIRNTVNLKDYPHLRLYAKNVAYEAATMEKDGKIEGSFRILSLKDSDGAAVDIPYEFTIPKLLTVEEAVEAIRQTVESLTLSNTDLGDGREEKEQYILKLAGDAVKGNEYSVTIKRGLEGEPALGSESGRATIILRLTYVTEESNFEDITCEFEVAG
ncbi:MAG: hypothetical protein IKW28_02620, partial [Lachnospiraceae bacterium]|nr:hypothetical protein [Lachnospiraceae bacterium]